MHKAFYTKNGRLIGQFISLYLLRSSVHILTLVFFCVGYAFDNVGIDDTLPLFPSVGLRTPREHVRANFGQEPFKYDIDNHIQHARYKLSDSERNQATPVE